MVQRLFVTGKAKMVTYSPPFHSNPM